MHNENNANVDVADLVRQYAIAAEEHGRFDLTDGDRADMAFRDIVRLLAEVDIASPNGREALTPLLDHPTPAVRLWAAAHLIRRCTDRAVAALEELGRMRRYPSVNARTTLEEWRAGRLKIPAEGKEGVYE